MALAAPRPSPAAAGRAPRMRARCRRSERAVPQDRRAASCRASPISTISTRCAPSPASSSMFVRAGQRRCRATRRWSCCRARRRRSPTSPRCAREGWDIDILAHAPPRRAGARALRRLPDARPHASPIPTASRARPARRAGLGLLDIDTVLGGDKRLAPVRGHRSRQRRAGARLRDASRRDHRARPRRGRCCALGGPRRRRGQRRRAGRRLLPARALRRRRFPPRLPRAARRRRRAALAYEARDRRRRSTRSPTISKRSLDLDALLAAARPPRLSASCVRCARQPGPRSPARCRIRQATEEQLQRAVDVGARSRCARAVAEPRVVDRSPSA